MRNRAKCNLCNDIIESFHEKDFIACKCDEIAIGGGTMSLDCYAKNWKNFLRVDDYGNVIVPKVEEEKEEIEEPKQELPEEQKPVQESSRPSKKDFLNELKEMLKRYESLNDNAKFQSVTHYDFEPFLFLLISFFEAES